MRWSISTPGRQTHGQARQTLSGAQASSDSPGGPVRQRWGSRRAGPSVLGGHRPLGLPQPRAPRAWKATPENAVEGPRPLPHSAVQGDSLRTRDPWLGKPGLGPSGAGARSTAVWPQTSRRSSLGLSPLSTKETIGLDNVCGTFSAGCEELPGCVVFVQIREECLRLHCGEPFVPSGPSL